MACDPSCHLADEDVLADGRANIGLDGNSAGREIEHFAANELTVGQSKARQSFCGRALVPAQDRTVDQGLVEEHRQLLGNARTLEGRAAEFNAQRRSFASRHAAFEAPKAIDVEDDGRFRLRCNLAIEYGTAG